MADRHKHARSFYAKIIINNGINNDACTAGLGKRSFFVEHLSVSNRAKSFLIMAWGKSSLNKRQMQWSPHVRLTKNSCVLMHSRLLANTKVISNISLFYRLFNKVISRAPRI
jgi:hypothetical protein